MDLTHRDILISQIVTGDAGDRQWDELTDLADADPTLWRELAHAQRDQTVLVTLMMQAARTAETVVAPIDDDTGVAPGTPHDFLIITRRLGAWTGWAVAAVLTLALIATDLSSRPAAYNTGAAQPTQQAGIIPVSTAAEALNAYLQKGREESSVIRELPQKILIQSRPNPAGDGLEVLYLRQLMERTVVPDLYELRGQDEHGRPTLVRFEQPLRKRM